MNYIVRTQCIFCNSKLQNVHFTPLHISNADFVGGNECKGNVTMRITNAQRCKNDYECAVAHYVVELNITDFKKIY